LDRIIDGDRFPLSLRIRTLRAIRAKIRPERCGLRPFGRREGRER
jgi:hypothetical protein